MQTDVDNNGRKVFWFEKNPDGNAVLVRPSGKRTVFRKKSDMPAMSDFGREGWQRAMLFGELHDCLDTNFACYMDATLGTKIMQDEDGRPFAYLFDTPQSVDLYLRNKLTEEQIAESRKYVDEFLQHPELQLLCPQIVLHNACFKIYPDDTLEPYPMTQVPKEILKHSDTKVRAMGMMGATDWETVEQRAALFR